MAAPGFSMRRLFLAALLSCSLPSLAAGANEEFLLGDVGVRIDLPAGWNMLRWSDWDFKAESADGQLKLFAWATPVQQELVEADVDGFVGVHRAKVEELHGSDPAVRSAVLEEVAGRRVVRSEIEFTYTGDLRGVLVSATVPVEGQMFHVSLLTAKARSARANEAMSRLLEALDVQKAPAPVEANAAVQVEGMSTRLPDGWRIPRPNEQEALKKAAQLVGVEDLAPCWSAIHPRAGVEPDVMFSCPGGPVMGIGLGLADAASFAEVEQGLRPRLFGEAPVPPAEMVPLEGRVGFLYAPDLGADRALRMGVAAYGAGLARVWAHGKAEAAEELSVAVRAALTSASLEGEYPVTVGERFSYAAAYNPSSPLVLGPVLALLLMVGGGIYLATAGRRSPEVDLSDEGA